MEKVTGALEIIAIIVVLTLTGVFTTFLVILNAYKDEIWEAIGERDNKTDD